MKPLLLLLLSLVAAVSAAATGGGGGGALEEEFGYVEVRQRAHMFWVLYHVDQPGDYKDYPLIMWLQGGPGASGVGYGNFEELGPYDVNGNAREHAWTKRANLLFVDNPVGTGYSYVEELDSLTTDNTQIANDLVALVKGVFANNTDLQHMPFFVYAESYGGKMTVDFALAFNQAIQNGEVVSDFRGVALGDSWISPMDSVNTWGMFLYQMGFVNRMGLQQIDEAARSAQEAVDAGRWTEATEAWSNAESVIMDVAHNVNFYNVLAEEDIYRGILKPNSRDLSFMSPAIRRLYNNHVRRLHGSRLSLDDFMNGEQAAHWNIPSFVVWDGQGGYVFDYLAEDFMKPVIDSVVRLLTETDIHVVVFTGNLDLICDTPGTYRWIEDMEWPGKPAFQETSPSPIYITSYSAPAALVQESGQFSLYTILRSGHMAPIDAPEAALKMVDMITASSFKSKKQGPKEEAPKEEATVMELPKEEAPKEAAPKEESPKEESPKVPKEEAPKEESPKEEAPKVPNEEAPKVPKEAAPEKVTQKKESRRKQQARGGHRAVPLNLINRARSRVVAAHLNPSTPTGKLYPSMSHSIQKR